MRFVSGSVPRVTSFGRDDDWDGWRESRNQDSPEGRLGYRDEVRGQTPRGQTGVDLKTKVWFRIGYRGLGQVTKLGR